MAARCAAEPGLLLEDAASALRAGMVAERAGTERDDSAVSVHAALAWSGRHLSPSAARLLRLLAVHPGPQVALPAAASLAALTEARTQAAVTELITAHLLSEPAAGRYCLHELPGRGPPSRLAWSRNQPGCGRRCAGCSITTCIPRTPARWR